MIDILCFWGDSFINPFALINDKRILVKNLRVRQ